MFNPIRSPFNPLKAGSTAEDQNDYLRRNDGVACPGMSQRETESIMNHFNDRTIQELVPFHLSASVAVNADPSMRTQTELDKYGGRADRKDHFREQNKTSNSKRMQSKVENPHHKVNQSAQSVQPGHEIVSKWTREEAESFVDRTVNQIVQDLPFRLINTSLNDGTLYGHTELTDVFKKSEEYSSLLSRITNAIDADKRGHDVHCTVSSYFRYAMLSHRWGAREPLYHDIQGNVYELKISPGIKKLQGFCQLASKQGFAWAWSDTCCIDKTCSGELQESLNTMFLWYRQSASTIVYLSDVHEASLDLLEKSVWFTRGWTLQELLAPRFLQFYTSDWSLLVDQSHPNSNHKTNLDVLKYVEEITTISKEELQDFVPGVQDARERLRWASSRELTRLEDRAYCLLGIFDVSLSILYGERERSFARLQEEIMKRTDELLLFDWVGASSSMNSLLASQPFCFTEEPCADALKLSSNPLADVVDMPLDITDAVLNKIPPHVQRFAAQMRTRSQSGHFLANGKIILSCFVHSVVHFTLEASNPAETEFTYRVLANDLKPLTITTTMKFLGAMVAEKDFIIANFFNDTVLAKDDHKEKTLTSSSQRGADSLIPDIDADEKAFCSRMLKHHWKPFVGYLLVSQGGGTYRRVPTKGRFIVEPQKGPTMGDNPMLVSTISVQ